LTGCTIQAVPEPFSCTGGVGRRRERKRERERRRERRQTIRTLSPEQNKQVTPLPSLH